ncbi:FG-GAP repeat domain-containing protein [Halalkalibaculum sp. DA3122]|uniref:FG-GAP repeat domain-containing protein n=1 Tax=Halalkalibaculum sp. DA3122 TaxID=3373607 RepID=UPI0037546F50
MIVLSLYLFGRSFSEVQQSAANPEVSEGGQLAVTHCSSCHTFPEPTLLPKKLWSESVLPAMAPHLGIFRHKFTTYPTENDPYLPADYYPETPRLTTSEWQKVLNYYEEAAPETLQRPHRENKIVTDSFSFTALSPGPVSAELPLVTAARFDTLNQRLYAADANMKKLLVFDRDLTLIEELNAASPIADIRSAEKTSGHGSEHLFVTYMGHLLPSNAPAGSVKDLRFDRENGEYQSSSTIADSLVRPVESRLADLNQDGKRDLLISEFGHRTGALFWLKKRGNGRYSGAKNMLIETPGCIETQLVDYNRDGLTDIAALCTQADQAIYLFMNRDHGKFRKKKLLQFPITYGSSSFQMVDFNDDGNLDILYTSGDNADYSPVLKPYHGVYIYINDGHNGFSREWFYPLHGAYDAKTSDFNHDGKLDIAAISFYADFENRPEEGFVIFKNDGLLSFTPIHHPAASDGRWISLDIADWNSDGYADILLGNFFKDLFSTWSENPEKNGGHLPFLLLQNNRGLQHRR